MTIFAKQSILVDLQSSEYARLLKLLFRGSERNTLKSWYILNYSTHSKPMSFPVILKS